MLAALEKASTVELWPENVESLQLFFRLQTQWRVGPRGPTGLDYSGVMSALQLMRVQPAAEFFDDLQAMETAALQALKG